MANASLGEPLSLRHAVALYSAQTVYGTAVTPATSLGPIRGRVNRLSGNQSFYGPGSADFYTRKGGSTYSDWAIQLPSVQTGQKAFLQKASRTAGLLPVFTLAIGYKDDEAVANKSASQVQDCKVNSLELNLDVTSDHNPLTASLSGSGGLVTTVTTLEPALLTAKPYMSFEAVFTRSAAAYPLRNLSLNVNHNLSRDYVIPGATPGSFPRGHKYLTEHTQEITGSISRYQSIGTNPQANTIQEQDMLLVFTNLDDASTLTVTLGTCSFDNEQEEQTDNLLVWSADFTAKTFAIT